MGEYSIKEFISESEKQQEFYKEQIGKFDKLLDDYKLKSEDLLKRKNSVLNNITKRFVPDFTQENLSVFSNKINSPEIADLFQKYKSEEQLLSKRISEIEKTDEYIKRDALTDPESGVIPSQMNEIRPLYHAAKARYDKLNGFPAIKRLRERKFGTSYYPHQGLKKYLSPEYYQDWKNADFIVAAMGFKDFIDVLSQYEESENQVKTFSATLKDFEDQIKKIKSMTIEHDEAVSKLKNLLDNYYTKINNILWNYLKGTEKTSLAKFFEGNAELEESYKTLDGLDHQVDYLNNLYEKVLGDRNKLVNKAGKLSEEAQRYKMEEYKYRNKRFTEDQFEGRFDRNEDRYNGMYDRYSRYGDTIYVFNDYGRSSLISDILWWDLITDGRIDGHFIPEVNQYHSMHPGYQYEGSTSGTSGDQS